MTMQGQIARPHRQPQIFWRVPELDFDTVFVGAMFAAALFILLLPKVGPLFFIGLPLLYFFKHPARIPAFSYRVLPILLFPLLCVLSTLWSEHRDYTLYFSILFVFTVVCAVIVGAGFGQAAIIRGLFAAFFAYAAVAVFDGVRNEVFLPGALGVSPFYGLAGSKNMSGDVAALGTLVGMAMISLSLAARQRVAALFGLLLIAFDLLLLVAAVSTGAVVSVLVGIAVMAFLSFIARMPGKARSVTALSAALVATLLVATRSLWFNALFVDVLRIGGKSANLTGRSFIWSRADTLIAKHPALGLGYNGFWVPGNLEAEQIWRKFLITNRSGFNFHSTPLDLQVHLGYVGLALFMTIFLVYALILVIRNLGTPTIAGNFFIAVLCYEVTRLSFESVGTGVFHYGTFLMFAALGWAARGSSAPLFTRSLRYDPARQRLELPAFQ